MMFLLAVASRPVPTIVNVTPADAKPGDTERSVPPRTGWRTSSDSTADKSVVAARRPDVELLIADEERGAESARFGSSPCKACSPTARGEIV